jgi:hypothetical protein
LDAINGSFPIAVIKGSAKEQPSDYTQTKNGGQKYTLFDGKD